MLAFPQTTHRGLVARIHDQLETADAFERDDAPRTQRSGCAQHGIVTFSRGHFADVVPERELRATVGAAIGLSVETAVARAVIFRLALGAHFEVLHRGIGPVVGQ